MMIYLHPNTDNPRNRWAAQLVAGRLHALGYSLCAKQSDLALFAPGTVAPADPRTAPFSLVASIGGDGTMLQAAQIAIRRDVPVFGVNSGRVGFLAAFEIDAFDRVCAADFEEMRVSERVLLEVTRKQEPGRRYFAVNEATVSKVNYAKTAEIALLYGKNDLGTLRCDGVIAATPTGSTGYSLSAGGPILEPSVNAVVLTPVCSHALNSHSYVFADSEPISIKPVERVKNSVFLSIDGNEICEIDPSDAVIVTKSERTLRLMTHPKRNFYDILYNEISERR